MKHANNYGKSGRGIAEFSKFRLPGKAVSPMTQIPGLIEKHMSIPRFETIFARRLQTTADKGDQQLSPPDAEPAKLVASNF